MIAELLLKDHHRDALALAAFRVSPTGVTMSTPGGVTVTLPESEVLRLYAWLGDVLGRPERGDR